MSRVVPPTAPAAAPGKPAKRPRGQVLILYVMAVFVFIGMLAVVLDISWYWINSNRVQKAADAAALAGVVWLPGDEPKAIQTAIYEASEERLRSDHEWGAGQRPYPHGGQRRPATTAVSM